jgi:7-carboxy-7-deazaguanine synthase
MKYPITSIFRSLQGEGHFVGYPMTFVRLAGCSVLGCSIRAVCDEAPWKATETLDLDDILTRVRQLSPAGIVCITGGEPTDHDLVPLLGTLKDAGFRVHIETSGVRSIDGMPFDWVTVSPKERGFAQRTGHTLKLVVQPEWEWHHIQGMEVDTTFLHRYLQPLTAADGSTNLAQVTRLLTEWDNYKGNWALSVQAHKTWGLR